MTKARNASPDVYITTALIWTSDTACIPVPVLGVFGSPDEAHNNAVAVLATLAKELKTPELLTKTITITPTKLDEAGVRSFLATLKKERSDLLKD